MPIVLYKGLEWNVVDDRYKSSVLISRSGSILRVERSLTQSLEAKEQREKRIQTIKDKNKALLLPFSLINDIKAMFRTPKVEDLTDHQLEVLEQCIRLRAIQEERNLARENWFRKIAEKCYCISIKQPWADAIFHGCKVITTDAAKKFKVPVGERAYKDIENRVWRLSSERLGSRIYIHASKGYCRDGEDWLLKNGLEPVSKENATLGAIMGSVIFLSDSFRPARPWAMQGQRHWEIYKPLTLPKPLPYKGQLKFFQIDRETLGLPSYNEEIKLQRAKNNA
jgi:hypothetical protein